MNGMEESGLIRYVVMMLIPAGIVSVVWLRNLTKDLGTKITGIWVSSDKSYKVWIYSTDSALQGDVVWADAANQRILGRSILQNVRLRFFLFGKGCYICPFSRREYKFRLRRLSKESLELYMTDRKGRVVANDTWSLVS